MAFLLTACASVAPDAIDPRAQTAALYLRQCAACHGERGRADGPLASYLFPPARSFSSGLFALVSTDNAMPADGDLAATIRRGMRGTAMPSFAWLSELQALELARHVRELAVQGTVEEIVAIAEHAGFAFDRAAVRERAIRDLAPGRSFDPLPEVPPTPEVLEVGRRRYMASCAACHGEEGKGIVVDPALAWRFDLRWPRDFTTGLLRGGTSSVAIQDRIEAGIPASGMPPLRLEAKELQALVAYVRGRIPVARRSDSEPPRVRLVARRVALLPLDPAHADWKLTPLPMWPLRSGAGVVESAEIAALHDGQDLAVLVRWPDATRDAGPADGPLPDAVALQLSADAEPPFLAMGSAAAKAHIWQWQAFVPREVRGILDLLAGPLRQQTDGPLVAGLRQRALAGVAGGRESMAAFADRGMPISVHSSWREGAWSVIFRRRLLPVDAREIVLCEGQAYRFAAAVWNGSAGQRGPDKSIAGWHEVVLQ